MNQESSAAGEDAWSDVREGAVRKFCFLEVDLAGHSEIARNNSTRDAEITFGSFLDYVQDSVRAYGGHTWGLGGDGGLFAFHDDDVTAMSEASVASGLDIVDHLEEFNRTRSRVKQQIRVRVAVHCGDARYLEQTGRIQSDDINFVVHLEKGKTEPDSVSISGTVYRELSAELRDRFRENGNFENRPVYTSAPGAVEGEPSRPAVAQQRRAVGFRALVWLLAVFLIVAAGGVWWWASRAVSTITPGQIKRLAVLPLANFTNDPEQDYFVDGMHDALLTELAKVGALTVISRQSVRRYRASEKPVAEIAAELGADALIEGSVMRSGDEVRINIQLIEAATDQHLWADVFDRKLENVLAMHMDVARAIAAQVKVTLTPAEEARLSSARKVNPEIYDAYLRGIYYLDNLETEKGLACLNEAIEKEPTDPLAYAALAHGYATIGHNAGAHEAWEVWPKAQMSALTAIQLDSTLAEAHSALAAVKLYYEWDWEGAERAFLRSLELNPNHAMTHYHYAWYLALFGQMDEAIQEHRRAQELDPNRLFHTVWLGELYVYAGRYEDAVAEVGRVLEMLPKSTSAHLVMGNAYREMGRYDEAIAEIKQSNWRGVMGMTYARAGRMAEARQILAEVESMSPPRAFNLAMIYSALGEYDRAFQWLTYEPHGAFVPWARISPWFTEFRTSPRFKDWLKKMNLPE